MVQAGCGFIQEQGWSNWLFQFLKDIIKPSSFSVRHYGDVIMGTITSQITSLTIVYSTVYSDADQRKHQSSASLVFVRGINWGSVNSPHKWPVTRKMFPFDDVIMTIQYINSQSQWRGFCLILFGLSLIKWVLFKILSRDSILRMLLH